MDFGNLSQLKTSEETFDFVCTACEKKGKRVEAVKYCVQCLGYCCQSCTDVHTVFPTLENHNLMEVNQASSQSSSLPEFPTERCKKHKGKVLDMYCEGHNTVGCSTCFVTDHKSCQDIHIHSIPDMIDTIFNLADSKQTQKLLKDMVASMETDGKSKDAQLETLNLAKNEALDKVTSFEKALEAFVRKAADASRQHVEDAHKELVDEILQDKHDVEIIREDLQTTYEKLDQSEGNRAQRFVFTKIAQEKLKEVETGKATQELDHNMGVNISFIPDQSLEDYVKTLHGIGQVRKLRKQKNDVYRVQTCRDINVKLADDSNTCVASGCCLTPDDHLLVTDRFNKKVKRIDIQKMAVVDYCTLDSHPRGMCLVSKHEVAVACEEVCMIQFVSIEGKLTPTRQIPISTHQCYGIAFNHGKLYMAGWGDSLYVYDMAGTLLKTVATDNVGHPLINNSRHVTFNEEDNRIFVGGSNGVVCLDGVGNYLSIVTDTEVQFANGVCVDGRGNMFVVGWMSHNVVQFSETGEKVGVIVKQGDGLKHPSSVCFHQRLNRLFVTMDHSNNVKMCELR